MREKSNSILVSIIYQHKQKATAYADDDTGHLFYYLNPFTGQPKMKTLKSEIKAKTLLRTYNRFTKCINLSNNNISYIGRNHFRSLKIK